MLCVRIKALFATTSARLSALYALLLVASFVLTGTLTWWVSMSAADRALRDRITLEMRALIAEAKLEGLRPVADAIRARAEQPGSLEYWFVDSTGELLAGDLPVMNVPDGWISLDLSPASKGAEGRDQLIILATTLPDGARLAIGDDLSQGERVRDTILSAMVWIGALTLTAGVAAGVVATRRMLARMDLLNKVITRVTQGELTARVPSLATQSADDIDRLGLGINAMLDRLAELVTTVRRISSDVAHELRTPLSHLQQKLEDAKSSGNGAEVLFSIEAAQSKAHDILCTFDAILRLAEIEAGTGRARFAPVSLGPLVERVIDAYRPDVEASGRRIEVPRLDLVEVIGDRDLLAQALANLLGNAMRHTPQGTVIRVEVVANGQIARLGVSDNGTGVPEAQRGRLLAPFVRLDNSRAVPGAGLGLSIVAAIATLHSATLTLNDAKPGLEVFIEFEAS